MSANNPLIQRTIRELERKDLVELKELRTKLLEGDNPDHAPMILSYIFHRQHQMRPRFRRCRNLEGYGGHDVAPHDEATSAALELRSKKRTMNPSFTRYLYKQRNLDEAYRRQKGLHNKRRREIHGRGANVKIGYRTPRLCRYFGPLGYPEVLVTNLSTLDTVDPRTHVVRIAHVGLRNRFKLEHRARTKRMWVTNAFKWNSLCNN